MALPKKTSFNPSDFVDPSTITRLLIVSYFIALALSLIDGANIKLLATPFMPEPAAHRAMRGVVLALSSMVLFGFCRRPAALVLALIIFWPSYISLYAGGDVSAFWRDLALIGALLMTSYEKQRVEIESEDDHGSEDHMLDLSESEAFDDVTVQPIDHEAYREDLNLVRSV